MKIVYITAHAPYGRGETFVVEEMFAVVENGVELLIIPRNPPKEVFHEQSRRLLKYAVWLPLLRWRFLISFLAAVITKPKMWKVLVNIICQSRNIRMVFKNLAVAPKAAFVAKLLNRAKVDHIHVHWGSTTATMAWIISELTGIPWSMTLHRWDIAENNLLKLKVNQADFVRCISEDGRREVLRIVGEEHHDKIKVLHMGVRLPRVIPRQSPLQRTNYVVACPANLVLIKGHCYLVDACAKLLEKDISAIKILIIGDGSLETEIRQQVKQLGLDEVVEFVGRLPHEQLMHMYERGEVDAVVLPSITTDDNEREGIPVTLMEAMAYGVPVVSTNTGGIPELLSDGAGIVVKEKDAQGLASAIEKLIKDEKFAAEVGKRGRQKVEEEFNLQRNVMLLLQNIKNRAKS